MALDPASKQIVANWLKTRVRNQACPLCGTNFWEAHDLMSCFASPNHAPGQQVTVTIGASAPMLHFVPLTCKQCAYTHLLRASHLGLSN